MRARKITLVVVLVILGLILIGCERQQISQSNADTGRFMNKTVGVKGRVMPTITFLGINYATVLQESDRRKG